MTVITVPVGGGLDAIAEGVALVRGLGVTLLCMVWRFIRTFTYAAGAAAWAVTAVLCAWTYIPNLHPLALRVAVVWVCRARSIVCG